MQFIANISSRSTILSAWFLKLCFVCTQIERPKRMEFGASSQFELHLELKSNDAHTYACCHYKIWFNQLYTCSCVQKKLRLFLFGRGHKKAKRQKAFNAINLMIYNSILVAWLVFLLWSYLRISLQTQFVCQNWNSIVEFHSFKPLFVSK